MDKEPQGAEMLEESMMLLRRNSIQKLFNGYDYDIEQLHHAMMQEERKKKVVNKEIVVSQATNGMPGTSVVNVNSETIP